MSNKKKPNFKILAELANECFMPLAYGGGINDFEDAKKIFQIGIEKVIINFVKLPIFKWCSFNAN